MPLGTARTQPVAQVRQAATKVKKNLLPPFDSAQWAINNNTKIISPYVAELNAAGATSGATITFPCLPNQTYTLSVGGVRAPGYRLRILEDGIQKVAIDNVNVNGTISYTMSAMAKEISISAQSVTAGTFTFANPQLEIGNVATPFEPYQAVSDLKQRGQLLAASR